MVNGHLSITQLMKSTIGHSAIELDLGGQSEQLATIRNLLKLLNLVGQLIVP